MIRSRRSVAPSFRRSVVSAALIACSSPVPRGPALATISPTALPTLDAWAHAVGGRDELARVATIHVHGRISHGGMSGPYEQWRTAGGARVEEATTDFLHETHVFDGTHGWLVDRNREVRPLAGVELDDELALAFVEDNAALLPERRAGTVAPAPDGTLVLTPAGGHRAVAVAFDPTTHLPRSYTRRAADKQLVTELSDWRRVGRVRMPFHAALHDGDPNDTVEIQLDAIDTTAAPGAAFARPQDRATDVDMPRDTIELPFELAPGSLIVTTGTVAGTSLSMIVDSGAESTVLNSTRLDQLHLHATGRFGIGAGGGDTVAGYVPHVTFDLAGAKLRDLTVAAIDFTVLEAVFGRRIDGILGYDFLSRFVVEIDYAHDVMRLHDRSRYAHAGGAAIPITLEGSTPWVDASIDVPGQAPIGGHFTIDTGCGCEVSLTTPFTDGNHLLDAFHPLPQGISAGAGGVTRSLTGEIPALHVGALTIDRPTADFARDATGATADPESAGLIGAMIFRHYVLVLDYAGERMWLDAPTGETTR